MGFRTGIFQPFGTFYQLFPGSYFPGRNPVALRLIPLSDQGFALTFKQFPGGNRQPARGAMPKTQSPGHEPRAPLLRQPASPAAPAAYHDAAAVMPDPPAGTVAVPAMPAPAMPIRPPVMAMAGPGPAAVPMAMAMPPAMRPSSAAMNAVPVSAAARAELVGAERLCPHQAVRWHRERGVPGLRGGCGRHRCTEREEGRECDSNGSHVLLLLSAGLQPAPRE